MPNTIEITIENDDGDEEVHELPSKFEVCGTCEGHGTHLHPAIGQHAYSTEEFDREFDEDERREYFKRGGMYDVQCEECKGLRVVPVVDEARLDKEDHAVYATWQKQQAQRAQWDREDALTRRMESGGWF
jgi:hypothetical protein